MLTNISSGNIEEKASYLVSGSGSVTYNSITYSVGQTFKGVNGITTYSTTGSPNVYQDFEAVGLEQEVNQSGITPPIPFFPKGSFIDSFFANGLEQEFNSGNVIPISGWAKGTFSDRFFALGLSIEFTPTVLTIRNSPIAMWF